MHLKPGYRTTELLAAVLASAAAWVANWAGTMSPRSAALVMAASTVGYQLSRGLAKLGAHLAAPQPAAPAAAVPPPPPQPGQAA
jgi:hypothetical protein